MPPSGLLSRSQGRVEQTQTKRSKTQSPPWDKSEGSRSDMAAILAESSQIASLLSPRPCVQAEAEERKAEVLQLDPTDKAGTGVSF